MGYNQPRASAADRLKLLDDRTAYQLKRNPSPATGEYLAGSMSAEARSQSIASEMNRQLGAARSQAQQDLDWADSQSDDGGSGIQFGAPAPAAPAAGTGSEMFNSGAATSAINTLSAPMAEKSYGNQYEQRLASLLDNPDSINQSAAYKFRVGQGQEALQRSLGARGMLNSGNRLMELTKYGQDMGSQEYGAQADRLSSLTSMQNQANIGMRGADTAAYGAQTARAGTLGDLLQNQTNAQNTFATNQGRLGLDTQRAQAEDYWRGKELSAKANRGGGGGGGGSFSVKGTPPTGFGNPMPRGLGTEDYIPPNARAGQDKPFVPSAFQWHPRETYR